jgi:diguanylate cyclase (GGDEF)-like protein/PAS domain S-box-containing protein
VDVASAGTSGRDEPALRAGEAHALAILDAALDAVVTIDHLGRILEFNRAAEQTFGYRRGDVLGEELAELLVPPAFREAHRRGLRRWTEAGPGPGAGSLLGRRTELRAMRADGSEFPAELAISRVDVPGPPLFTACIRDLTDRQEADGRLRRAEGRFRTLVEQLPIITYIDVSDDPVSRPLYISPQVEHVLGYTVETWIATPGIYEDSIHPDDRERVLSAKQDAYRDCAPLRLEYRMVGADGRHVWVEDQSVHVRPSDGPSYRQGFAVDLTERKRAERDLGHAEARFRTLVEQLPLAVYIDRVDEASSNIYTSPQIEQMLGYTTEEWVSDADLFVHVLHPDDREAVLAAHAATHATGEPLQLEYRLRARDGRVVWVHDEARVVRDPAGGAPVLQGYLLDVTERREAEELLRRQAFHDPLTELANRALFADRVQHALVLRRQAGGSAAVLFLDLDDFKRVNDTLGHAAGDALLREVGTRLVGALSASHTIARLGGDEFAVLIEEVREPEVAAGVADRVLAALQTPFGVEGRSVFVTASMGIAIGNDADELLRSADVAMYRAKAAGKAQYAFYAPAMDEALLGRLELIADLRRADVAEEFVLHYQPTVDLRTGVTVGVEALVRWQHPTRGLLQPDEFIAASEETGLVLGLGRWVLAEACRTAARWRRELPGDPLSVSVNVSARQLQEPGFADDVRAALRESGLESRALTLEITEGVLAEGRDGVVAVLEALKGVGVRLALDDFGTGYSSLSRLRHLPVDTLKVDRSFVEGVEVADRRAALTGAIIELGRALGLTVVAEGIETPGQAAAFRRLGCRLAQGFFFAPPLAAVEFEALMRGMSPRAGSPAA